MNLRYHFFTLATICCFSLALIAPAEAQWITDIAVENTSSDMPDSSDLIQRYFATESTLMPLTVEESTISFTHRMAFLNTLFAGGGFPQANKRNVVFQLTFTVKDPNEQGYHVDLTSVMRGVSSVTQTEGGQTAFATGLSYGVTYGVNLTDPGDFTNLWGLYGQNTSTVSVDGEGSVTVLQEVTASVTLGGVLYVGTNTFSIYFTSVPTPTTNVVFQNHNIGSGYVNYGLGSEVGDTGASPNDLGHFLTVAVTFEGNPTTVTTETWSRIKALFE